MPAITAANPLVLPRIGTVPPTGLEATTRAFAKIVDDVNKADLKDLVRRSTSDAANPRR